MYESEIDRFIREMKAQDPMIEEQQRRNRATWWDRPQDLERWKERAESTVPQPGYVYFPLPRHEKDDQQDSDGKVQAPTRAP